MSASDDFTRGITLTANTLGTVPTLIFPATPNVSWKVTDLQALVTPAKWTATALADSVQALVNINAVVGVSVRITAGTFRLFCEVPGAIGQALYSINDNVGTRWVDYVNVPAVNDSDSTSLTGEISTNQGSIVQAVFDNFVNGREQSIAVSGYAIAATQGAAGQLLRVWDGPSGTGVLLASYMMSCIGGQNGSFSDSPNLSSSPGNQLTVDVDGAVAAPTFSIVGNVGTSSTSTPSNTSLLATAAPI